jgi:hypothetical protein
MNLLDIKCLTHKLTSPGRITMEFIHRPTGLSVFGSGDNPSLLRESLLKELEKKVEQEDIK